MGTLQGSWIWYELMSPDPEGSKAFYEAVIGWSMENGFFDVGVVASYSGVGRGWEKKRAARRARHRRQSASAGL